MPMGAAAAAAAAAEEDVDAGLPAADNGRLAAEEEEGRDAEVAAVAEAAEVAGLTPPGGAERWEDVAGVSDTAGDGPVFCVGE